MKTESTGNSFPKEDVFLNAVLIPNRTNIYKQDNLLLYSKITTVSQNTKHSFYLILQLSHLQFCS